MRYESTATSLSWIPSEAVTGMTKLPFDAGVAHYDATPPEVLEDLDALRDADRFRFANQLPAWIEVEDGKIVGYGQDGSGHDRLDDDAPRLEVDDHRRLPAARRPARARGRRRLGPLHPDRRRPHRRAHAPPGQPPAVRAGHRAARLEHAAAHPPRRRSGRARADRRQPVPPPLGLRRRRQGRRQDRRDRVQEVVPQGVRQALAVGRRGLAGARHRGRDRARADAVRAGDEGGREARHPQGEEGQAPHRAGHAGRRAVPAPRRRARGRGGRRAARRARSRAPCWASGR